MTNDDLAWTVEQACLNAWPSPRQAILGTWLVRAAGGPSRRINSVNPLRAAHYDPLGVIEESERIYADLGQRLVFRVPDLARGMNGPLAARGFDTGHQTCTLFTALDAAPAEPGHPAVLTPAPTAAWLALRSRLSGDDPVADRVVRGVTEAVVLPKIFVGVEAPEGLAAIAFGAIDRGLLVIEAVGTDPSLRGRGHARQAVGALMAWARRQGARGACLQVVAANVVARRLYDRLGFRTELYRYHYRFRAPAA